MRPLKTTGALFVAALSALAISHGAGRAQPPSPSTAAVAAADIHIAERQSRVMHMIRAGRAEGWLDRRQAEAADRALRRLREREKDMRAANGGRLTPEDRSELQQGLDDLIQDLRWTRMRHRTEPYRPR